MSPSELVPAPPTEALAHARVALAHVVTLDAPTALAVRRGDPALYVAERAGTVRRVRGGRVASEPVLDLSPLTTTGGERGLLGLAFSPDGRTLVASYTDREGDSRVVAYTMGTHRADVGTGRELLHVDQPFANHNGGHIAFGPDGMLYVGLGDGGGAGDPLETAQSLGTLLGKLVRLAPDGSVPPDNPFTTHDGARPEIWAYGLRNPWRFSFDRSTGQLWIADVGQNRVEEIDLAPSLTGRGANYGWDVVEGTLPFEGRLQAGMVAPVHEYARAEGRCAVTGGFVYRGRAIPGLRGAYVYGDFCDGHVRALRIGSASSKQEAAFAARVQQLVSFGEDLDGELYVLSLAGPLYRLVPG